jgi:hypothetical protein
MRWLALALMVLCAGCGMTRADYIKAHPEWSEQAKANVLKSQVEPGMTWDQVEAAWGSPKDLRFGQGPGGNWAVCFFEHDSLAYDWRTPKAGCWSVRFEQRGKEMVVVSTEYIGSVGTLGR